jgi:hypothetical protein
MGDISDDSLMPNCNYPIKLGLSYPILKASLLVLDEIENVFVLKGDIELPQQFQVFAFE